MPVGPDHPERGPDSMKGRTAPSRSSVERLSTTTTSNAGAPTCVWSASSCNGRVGAPL